MRTLSRRWLKVTGICLALCAIGGPTASRALAAEPPPGVVIDHSPAKSKQYIGSPSLALLPTGEYVASHDFFGPGSTIDTTVVWISRDRGKSWTRQATIQGQWWSTLFVHRQDLYLMGTTKEYGACVIRKSTDSGKTWTSPVDENSGLLHGDGKYHCAPVPVVIHNGRIWRAMEEFSGPKWGAFQAFMMSAAEEADLLKTSSWTSSNRIAPAATWLGGQAAAILEGNAVVTPEGQVVNLLRVHQPGFEEVAALMRVSPDGKRLSFDPQRDFVRLPGASKKFTIRYDARSKMYWALVNFVPEVYRQSGRRVDQLRNTLVLVSSTDLRQWDIQREVLRDPDVHTVGFQYADWLVDGDDILAVVRTAFPEADGTKAHNAHDANWMTFHRIVGFRK